MRVKRGILDVEFKDGIFFSLKLPGIQWTKELGNSALGAAFGIVLNNELEVEISKLNKQWNIQHVVHLQNMHFKRSYYFSHETNSKF